MTIRRRSQCNPFRPILASFLSIWLLCGCQSARPPQGVAVQVTQVISGNTLEVIQIGGPNALAERVRLLGIEAPDLEQAPWGNVAKERLTALTQGKTVLLEPDLQSQDSFQRRLAYVWLEGALVNEQLVAEGQALAVGRSPNTKYDQRLQNAQEQARLLGAGIWNPDQPMRQTPAEFREQKRP